MKIVYVIDSLASKGGAERILSDKMNYMVEHFGYDVYVITCLQDLEKNPNVYFLSEKVTQINLNIHYYAQYQYCYPQRLWVKYSIYKQLKKKLTAAIQQIDPDVLIGLGYFNADMVCGINCKAVKIVESHEARIFTLTDKGLSRSFFSREFMKFYRKLYFRRIENNSDVVVTLTNGDAEVWKKAKSVKVIPNFTMMPLVKQSSCENKRVIAVGRLEWQKGFDRLIDVWAIVNKTHSDWQLDIFGSGTFEDSLKKQISSYGLTNVTIHPFSHSINREYAESSILASTSRYEGFALVILEAMNCGLPCVSFNCPYGASDIIINNGTGFIVKDGNITAFANSLCRLIEDEKMRKAFSCASRERVKLFNVDTIMSRWKSLLEEMTDHHL